ncbi:MAG: hypothetical protein ABJP70_03570 [Erythrobacter sp.]
MTALPPDDARTMRGANPPHAIPVRELHARWSALHDRADELALMAQLATEPRAKKCDAFANLADGASDWQRNLAAQALDDIEAMMEPGLTALKFLEQRNQDPCSPALALWREFYSARDAVLTMFEHGATGVAVTAG